MAVHLQLQALTAPSLVFQLALAAAGPQLELLHQALAVLAPVRLAFLHLQEGFRLQEGVVLLLVPLLARPHLELAHPELAHLELEQRPQVRP